MTTVLDEETAWRAKPRDDAFDYSRAVLNILEDSAADREDLKQTQRAVLNILDDAASEKEQLRDMQSAVLNVLDDFGLEKRRLEDTEKAILNILEDLAAEKNELERAQREIVKSTEAIRLSLREKETLLKEIHHRVKNNLQVIASLLRLQARHLRDEEAKAIFVESQNRVHSISLVHEMLYQAGDLARVDFGQYLETLTRSLFENWRAALQSIEIGVEANGVQLAVDNAIPCGLIVNELVTNALKHAFPEGRSGKIQVKAAGDGNGGVRLVVQDNGIGIPEKLDLQKTRTLGLELVSTLVRQLHAGIEIRREAGTAFEISFQTGV